MLDVNLGSKGLTQEEAGMIGFVSVLAGGLGGILVGGLLDRCTRLMKSALILLQCLAFLCFSLLTLTFEGFLFTQQTHIVTQLFVFAAAGGFFLNCTLPLYFNWTLEATFPLPEGKRIDPYYLPLCLYYIDLSIDLSLYLYFDGFVH